MKPSLTALVGLFILCQHAYAQQETSSLLNLADLEVHLSLQTKTITVNGGIDTQHNQNAVLGTLHEDLNNKVYTYERTLNDSGIDEYLPSIDQQDPEDPVYSYSRVLHDRNTQCITYQTIYALLNGHCMQTVYPLKRILLELPASGVNSSMSSNNILGTLDGSYYQGQTTLCP